MTSYFLEPVPDLAETEAALNQLLPGPIRPWIVWHAPADPIAYAHVGTGHGQSDAPHVQADISGRHY